jgi:acetolactate synthase-1/2/3 large subunit
MAGPLVADRIALACHAAGIRFAFGMPGGEVVTLVDALERAGIRFVLARNETAAAMMAAGCSTAGGAPGLLVTTLGPGLANAVNGIADAWQERIPLIVVSGVVERALRGRYTHQVVDHAALLRPLVKASFEIEADGPSATLARAIRLAQTPPFGPVHLDLSPAVAAQQATEDGEAGFRPCARPSVRLDPDEPRLAEIRARLGRARRPLLIAGMDALRENAAPGIRALADRGVPVITTYKAKGLLDEHHPSSLGAAGLSPLADHWLGEALHAADVVLLAGYDPIEMRQGWLDPFPSTTFVAELGGHGDHAMHRATVRCQGPVGALLAALTSGKDMTTGWPDAELSGLRHHLAEAFRSRSAWGPHAVFEVLARQAGDATLTIDSGAHRILLSQMWRASRPLGVLQSAGWCTMGAAIPLAIGVGLADPSRRVVAVLGDGGLEMTLGELGTLRDQDLPVTVLVLQDESLALIALKQRAAGLAPTGVQLGQTDYAAVARAFGGQGFTCRTAAELEVALDAGRKARGFTVIACRIDGGDYAGRI